MSTPKVSFGENYGTSQIYSQGFEFAFMSRPKGAKVYEQATTFVYCKDFLHDAIWASLHGTKVEIFGFKYDSSKDKPLKLDRTALTFRNTQYQSEPEKFHERMEACIEFLQGVDRLLNFRPTQIYQVPHDSSPCWLVLADKRWQHAPTMLSLYTLFIRIGFFHTPGEEVAKTINRAEKGEIKIGPGLSYAGNLDCSYVKQARRGIEVILKHGLDVFHRTMKANYPEGVDTHLLHDGFGIVNFTQGKPKGTMPHWYREELWK